MEKEYKDFAEYLISKEKEFGNDYLPLPNDIQKQYNNYMFEIRK